MNKQIAIFCIVALGILYVPVARGATESTRLVTPTVTEKSKQIQELKERLATKVAELRQLEKRAVDGVIKSTSVSTITVEMLTKDIKIELVDDLKVIQYLKGKRETLTTDDLARGDLVVVFGDYDVTLDLLKAKVILITTPLPTRIHGTVTDVDGDAYTLTVKTPEGTAYIVDFERTTRTLLWNQTDKLEKGGFSKIKSGDLVHITGTAVPKKENQLSAIRILDIGNLSGVTPTEAPSPTETLKATPTTKPKAPPTE